MANDGWKVVEEQSKAFGGDGLFVKLDTDGSKVVGCFLGNPELRALHYTGSSYEPFTAAHKEQGKAPTTRTSINFYVPADKQLKILEMNKTTLKDVLDFRNEGKYDFDEWFFEIKRSGVKGDKNTTYRILPETKIDAEHRAIIMGLKLHDLRKVHADDSSPATDMASHEKAKTNGNGTAAAAPPAATDTQIDADTTAALINRLKMLPREKLGQFMAEFKIQQVKMLPNKSLPDALRMLDKLEGKPEAPPPAAAPQEIDPFAE